MDIPRIFNITESAHRIHNPITAEKLATLGAALRLEAGARVLDLGSGSGEMLCTWARDHGVVGTGIDMSRLFTEQARLRAEELGVADQVTFIHGDAAGYVSEEKVGVAACIGATWIAGGVAGTIELLARSARKGGIILIGEPYWRQLPLTEEVAKGCLANSIDWLFPLGDVNDTSYPSFIAEVGALAMGSSTYEWMLRHAETVAAETGSAWPYAQPTWVFSSRTLPPIAGADLHFVRGDVRPVHAVMRAAAGGRNIWIVGGGDLAGQFHDAGLLDEVIVQVGSVTLGEGKPLFPRRVTNPPLTLVSVRQVGAGFAELRYQVPSSRTAGGA